MKALALAALIAFPVAAVAEERARPLGDVLAAAKAQDKPALLDFGAVWCIPCKMLAKALAQPELAPLLSKFVVARYDAERGAGKQAAARYDVNGFPTLVIVDGDGRELARQASYDEHGLGDWLKRWGDAGQREARLEARAKQGEVGAMFALAARAESAHDEAAQRRWLDAVESADRSQARKDAARAAWLRLTLDAKDKVDALLAPLLLDFAARHPTEALHALQLAAQAGADRKLVAATFEKVIAVTDGADALNLLAYAAIDAGALDAALHAAEKQRKLSPDDANALDTLAEVLSARGEKQRAVETERRAIAMAKEGQRASMQSNLERFEHGTPYSDPDRPSLRQFVFGEEKPDWKMPPATAADVARAMFAHDARLVGCAGDAPKGIEQAYVRVRVGASPHLEKIELLEPGATAAFKRCVEKALRAVDVPPDSEPAEVVVGFHLHPQPLPDFLK